MTTPGSENRPQGEYQLHVILGVDDQYQTMLNNALKTHLSDAVKNAVASWNKMMTGVKPDAGDRGTAVIRSSTWVDSDGAPT